MSTATLRALLVLGLCAWPACVPAQSHAHGPQAHATPDPHAGHAAHAATPASAPPADAEQHPVGGHAAAKDTSPPAPRAGASTATATAPHAGHAAPPTGTALPREPIPEPTDADREAAFQELYYGHHDAHGAGVNSLVSVTRLEGWNGGHGSGQAWEIGAWVGNDLRRAWLRSEGEREDGSTAAADVELLYGRALGPWSELLLGMRQDLRPGPSRSWAAIGIEGLTPYKFEMSAMAYLGNGGHSVFTVDVEYDVLLSNRLVLQPQLGLEAHGRDDPRLGAGSGLSSIEAALRLRYEVTRQFAPYLGVAHQRAFGGTADLLRQDDAPVRDTRWIAGVRWWF